MVFGGVTNSYRRTSRKDGTLQKGYNYAIVVWQKDIPVNPAPGVIARSKAA